MDKNKKMSKVTKGVLATVTGLGLAATLVPTVKVIAGNNTDECYITVDYNIPGLENGTIKVEKNTQVKDLKLEPVEGYMFKGWYKDEACTQRYLPTEIITADSVVFAKLEVATYAVVFPTSDYFEVSIDSKIVEYGSEVSFKINLIGDVKDNRVVEVNGQVILPDANGVYTILGIYENTVVVIDGITPSACLVLNVDGNYINTVNGRPNQTLAEVLQANDLEYNEYNTCGWYLDEDLTQVADLDMIVDGETNLYTKTVSEEMLAALNITPLDTNSQQVMAMAFNIRALEEQVETNTATFAISDSVELSEIVIPKKVEIDEVPYEIVTGMFDTGNTNVTKIVLPTSMKTTLVQNEAEAGEYGIVCPTNTTLTYLNLHDNIEQILDFSLAGYKNLPIDLSVMKGLKTIGTNVLYESNITNLTIPESITEIQMNAFFGSLIENLTIPESVTSIGDSAFSNCTALQTINWNVKKIETGEYANIFYNAGSGHANGIAVTFGANVEEVPDYLFYVSDSNSSYYPRVKTVEFLGNKVTSIGKYTFQNCSSLTEITIPEGVTDIGEFAFYRCWSLTEITIPEGVTDIGGYAFFDCTALKEIIIPESVTSIRDRAFYGCTALQTINWNVKNAEAYDIFGNIGSELAEGEGVTVTFGENVEVVPDYLFQSASKLKNVQFLGNKLTSIGDFSFRHAQIENITIPESVTNIGDWAFQNTTLRCINIPEGVVVLEESVFAECYELTDIYIPRSVKIIREDAFRACTNLANIHYSGTEEDWESITILDTSANLQNATKNYSTTSASDKFIEIDNVKYYKESEQSYVAYGLVDSTGTSISLHENTTSIIEEAFKGCSSLISITIPEGVTSVGNNAFYGCTSLQTINWNAKKLDTLLKYNSDVFCNAGSALEEGEGITVTFGANVEEVPDYLFRRESYYSIIPKIKTVIFEGSKVTKIGQSAFYLCQNLTSITIPESVTSIGDRAFWACIALEAVNFTENSQLISIEDAAFELCENLTSIIIPAGVTSIGQNAFSSCENLTSIIIPASVTEIGYGVFYSCSALSTVYYTGSETDREGITIGNSNGNLTNATWVYNYVPTEE